MCLHTVYGGRWFSDCCFFSAFCCFFIVFYDNFLTMTWMDLKLQTLPGISICFVFLINRPKNNFCLIMALKCVCVCLYVCDSFIPGSCRAFSNSANHPTLDELTHMHTHAHLHTEFCFHHFRGHYADLNTCTITLTLTLNLKMF